MTAVYWRIEWHQHDILTRPAMSTGWSGVDGKPPTTQIGLTACRSARALVAYWQPWIETVERLALCEPEEDDPRYADWADHDAEIRAKMHRVPTDSSRVLIFTGRRLGSDQDGYPLVEPEYVITETTYGRLLKHPCLAWLDGAEADDVPALLRAPLQGTTGRPDVYRRWSERGYARRGSRAMESRGLFRFRHLAHGGTRPRCQPVSDRQDGASSRGNSRLARRKRGRKSMTKLTTSDLLTIAAAAEAAGVPEQTLRDAVARGDLASRLVAGRWRVVERSAVQAWAAHRPRKRGRPAGR